MNFFSSFKPESSRLFSLDIMILYEKAIEQLLYRVFSVLKEGG